MGGRTGRSRDAQMKKLIAQYLPRASKGPRTAAPVMARVTMPDDVPLPNFKPTLVAETTTSTPMMLAHGRAGRHPQRPDRASDRYHPGAAEVG